MAPLVSLGKFRRAVPEVWFRIVHVASDHARGCVDLREQTVEIALGPEGAFENGNIGVLTRQVPADRVVSAVPPPRYPSRPPAPPREPRTPQVVDLLRKAHAWRQELDAGTVANQAEIARREGVTRARVTQIMMLLRLAPDIQAALQRLPCTVGGRDPLREHHVRPIAIEREWASQRRMWDHLTPS